MTAFYKRLLYLCELKGTTPLKLVRACGLSTSMPTNWKRDDTVPNSATMQKLADALDVPVSHLNGEADDVRGGKWVKVLGRVAAGLPIEAIEDVVDQEQLSPNLDYSYEYCGLVIHGDSMYPTICDGDTVIVRLQSQAETGDTIIVFVNGSDATCKKYRKTDDGIDLIPANPKYGEMHFTEEQIKTLPIQIFGKVIELRRKFK